MTTIERKRVSDKEYRRKQRLLNREAVNAYQRKWTAENPEKVRKYRRKRHEYWKAYYRQSIRDYKIKVLTHYGKGKCVCVQCGEARLACLSIDHINGGGTEQRRKLGRGGSGFYVWLVKQDFPKGYQTLCMNCQFVKRDKEKEYGDRSYKS